MKYLIQKKKIMLDESHISYHYEIRDGERGGIYVVDGVVLSVSGVLDQNKPTVTEILEHFGEPDYVVPFKHLPTHSGEQCYSSELLYMAEGLRLKVENYCLGNSIYTINEDSIELAGDLRIKGFLLFEPIDSFEEALDTLEGFGFADNEKAIIGYIEEAHHNPWHGYGMYNINKIPYNSE